MKAIELRISNLVEFEGQLCKVTGITQMYNDGPYKIEVGFSDGMFSERRAEDLTPVLITEEWLLKFGFMDDSFANCYWISDSKRIFHYDIEKKRFYVLDGFRIDIADNIECIHQLQNLYFALTGEELEITD